MYDGKQWYGNSGMVWLITVPLCYYKIVAWHGGGARPNTIRYMAHCR